MELTRDQQRALALARARRRRAEMASTDVRGTGAGRGTSLEAALIGARQGVTFGFGDEINAGVRAAGDWLSGKDFGASYDQRLAHERALLDQVREEDPGATFAGEIGGAVLPALLTGGGAAPMTARQMAASGAAAGAAYGAGEGQGVGGRLENAALGGILGAGTGYAAQKAAPYIAKGAARAKDLAREAVGLQPRSVAERNVATLIARSANNVDDELAAAQAAGQGDVFTLADAIGDPAQRELSGIAVNGGPGRDLIVRELDPRQLNQSVRVTGYLDEALSPDGKTARQVEREARAARSAIGKRDYGAARTEVYGTATPGRGQVGKGVDITFVADKLDDILGKAPEAGFAPLDDVDKALIHVRRQIQAAKPEVIADDAIRATRGDFNEVQRLRSALDQQVRNARKAGDYKKADAIREVVNGLDDALGEVSPSYREAVTNYRTATRAVEAVPKGKDAASARIADVADDFGRLQDDAERVGFRAGYGDTLAKTAERTAETGDAARALRNEGVRQKVRIMAGDDAADRLVGQLDRERAMTRTNYAALGGSPTAEKLFSATRAAATAREAAHDPFSMVWNLGRHVLESALDQGETARLEIAKLLLATGDPKAPQLAQALRAGRNLSESEKRIAGLLIDGGRGVYGPALYTQDRSE